MSKSIGFYCPVCGRRMHARSRKRITPLYHTLITSCPNPECLASYAVSIGITHPIQESLLQQKAQAQEDERQLSLITG